MLRDNRDSVTLTWTYPKCSEGPVLLSGGRLGQDRRAFQQFHRVIGLPLVVESVVEHADDVRVAERRQQAELARQVEPRLVDAAAAFPEYVESSLAASASRRSHLRCQLSDG